jgi:16S rRNA (cytidine1402-2'-O)-methyltransferase
VLAEDTRRTRILLDRHAVKARPLSLHAHNETARASRVLATLDAGGAVALVSDAGTPLVSDPGARLVAAALEAGHEVTAIPGPSAPLAAMVVSGLPAECFAFQGFLPRRKGAREALLASLRDYPGALIFFESPRRVAATLRALAATLGDRPACVARELTKLHEEAARGTLLELAEQFSEGARGEITIVVGAGAEVSISDPADLDDEIRERLVGGHSSREIATELARASGLARRAVYERVLVLRGAR